MRGVSRRRPGRLARAAGDRGAVAVELAVVTPLLLLIVCGIIDFGRAVEEQITITNAARAGARAAAMGASFATIDNTVWAATPNLSGTSVTVEDCVQPEESEGESTYVTVDQPFTFVTPLGAVAKLFGRAGLPSSFTLTATATMPCET